VSTDKQVDYNDSHQADIPMQRRECHRFAEEHGWIIIHEEQEDGVSWAAPRLTATIWSAAAT
jgi:DNA invertase Pin-like site-specific DNA recombinase